MGRDIHLRKLLIFVVALACVSGFQARWGGSELKSCIRTGGRERVQMANAFLSPSVITRQKRDEVMNDPFDSPSALINGGTGKEASKCLRLFVANGTSSCFCITGPSPSQY
jgi:hypothetical protein